MPTSHERIIVSVGGSLIVPDQIDTAFLTRFRALILDKVVQGFSFSIIAGGGKTARRYQEAAQQVRGDLPRDDLDWLGIHSTRLNGHLLRALFREQAHHTLIKDPTEAIPTDDSILIAAGWKPGWSTDYCAVMAAKTLGATRLVNLSNIDYVYDSNPKENPNARKIEKISWPEFRKLIPKEWDPGLSSPFDPVAAKEAEALGLEVVVMNGANLSEFSNYIDHKPFIGTVIA
jgi:uridylate kinase